MENLEKPWNFEKINKNPEKTGWALKVPLPPDLKAQGICFFKKIPALLHLA